MRTSATTLPTKAKRAGSAPAARHRAGRPTAAESRLRQERLLEVAGVMFMKHGFDGTSIEAVAEAAGMSKRTVYARHADKAELFSAVLRGLIDRWLVPINQFGSSRGPLEPTLIEIGRHLLVSALAPSAVSVHRILIAESERRPAFGRLANSEGWQPAVRAIAAVLRRHEARLRPVDLEAAAEQFISLVVDNSLRLATLGVESEPDVEARVRAAVDLFLNGVRLPERLRSVEP